MSALLQHGWGQFLQAKYEQKQNDNFKGGDSSQRGKWLLLPGGFNVSGPSSQCFNGRPLWGTDLPCHAYSICLPINSSSIFLLIRASGPRLRIFR